MPDSDVGRTDRSGYRPWDRDEKLGPVPEGGFMPDDPKVIAWEAAHGHDLRLKCLPEFGCVLVEARAELIEEAARELLTELDAAYALHGGGFWRNSCLSARARLRVVLDA